MVHSHDLETIINPGAVLPLAAMPIMCVFKDYSFYILHFVIMFISFCHSTKGTTNTVNAEVAASGVTSEVQISDIKLKI